jgi:hypothetical protein
MNKLMMTVGSVALMALASPVLAQSTSNGPATSAPITSAPPATPGPAMTAPNNSSVNAPQDMAPMPSKGSTSAVAPAAGTTPSSDTMGNGDSSRKPMKMSHKMHHGDRMMDSTKTSGSKSTDHDAEQLNQQELGKLQSPN